jgi:hypothetical protein
MIKLPQGEFAVVKPLFVPLVIDKQAVTLMINGDYPARIFTDRQDNPTAALISAGSCYLGGSANVKPFNEKVKNLIVEDILPRNEGEPLFVFSSTNEWRDTLDELLSDYGVSKFKRIKYELSTDLFKEHHSWRNQIPEGYAIRKIDHSLIDSLPDYALEYWGNGEKFL